MQDFTAEDVSDYEDLIIEIMDAIGHDIFKIIDKRLYQACSNLSDEEFRKFKPMCRMIALEILDRIIE